MPALRRSPRPHKRKGFWYLVRRVPGAFSDVDGRGLVMLSSGIRVADDPRGHSARDAVATLDRDLFRRWQDLKAGRDPDGEARYKKALETARTVGVSYLPAADVANLPLSDLVQRVERIDDVGKVEEPGLVAAVLGGERPPPFMLSGLRGEFERINAILLTAKSERQLRRWRAQRDAAVETFISVLGGDRSLASLKRTDVLAVRRYWQDRILRGEVEVDTGNKNITRVGAMFRAVNENLMLGLGPIFEKTTISGGRDKQRVAFKPDFVQEKILAEGMFDDLNPEARRVVYLVAETGLRLSEACNLSKETIKLDASVPHVQVRPEGREMKTQQSKRDIPLVGVALMAMRAQPEGFPRYRDKADSLSALVNKALETRGMRPEPGQSLYSLRHTFEDRLTAVEAPEKVVAALMGHKWHRPRYGLGPSLEQKRDWLKRIAFRPPRSV
jgi:integrase